MRPLILILAFSFIPAFASGDTLHVPSIYPTIQSAVDVAKDGDVVLVADGTYTGLGNRNINTQGKLITVESESGYENCVIDCSDKGRGFLINSGETRDCVIRGFTIKNGDSPGGTSGQCGLGISIWNSSPVIESCWIKHCGYVETGSNPEPHGGGIFVQGGHPLILNCCIEFNTAGLGGGIFAGHGGVEIVGCVIRNNSAKYFVEGFYPPAHWEGQGAGLCLILCSPILVRDCVVTDNNAYPDLIWGYIYGDGATVQVCDGSISNCTFKGADGGSGYELYLSGTNPILLENSIVVFDGSTGSAIQAFGSYTVQYCDVQGGFPGTGNFDADPEFENPLLDDFRLKPTSPCIEAGDPGFAPVTYFKDIDNAPRILDGDLDKSLIVDMGAYEFSNIHMSLAGPMTPGSNLRFDIEGKAGLFYMALSGYHEMNFPPMVKPFGHLLIQIAFGLPPILPLGIIPNKVKLTIPSFTPPGTTHYLLPICMEGGGNHAGNFGAYYKVVVQ